MGIQAIAQLAQYLPGIFEALGSMPSTTSVRAWRLELSFHHSGGGGRGSKIQGLPTLGQTVSLRLAWGCMRPYL